MAEEQIVNQTNEEPVQQNVESAQESIVNSPETINSNNESIPSVNTPKVEKMFSRDELAKITNAERNKAYEQARREILVETQSKGDQSAVQNNSPVTADQVRGLIDQEAQRRMMEHQANTVAREFTGKIDEARSRYSDFDSVISKVDFTKVPELVTLANSVENTGDVMYDIAKNPTKFANVLVLARSEMPQLAHEELKRLSLSIKQNREAVNQKQAEAPLSQVQPSNTGMDNGSSSVQDLRKQDWMYV